VDAVLGKFDHLLERVLGHPGMPRGAFVVHANLLIPTQAAIPRRKRCFSRNLVHTTGPTILRSISGSRRCQAGSHNSVMR